MLPYPFSSPQAFGEALYRRLLVSDPSAWKALGELQERQRAGTVRPWDGAVIASLNAAHARYASLRYAGPGAPSWYGYGMPAVNVPGIVISGSGPRAGDRTSGLDAPTTNHLLSLLRRCWRAPVTSGYDPRRKDTSAMFPYQPPEDLPPSISGVPGMGPVPNPAYFHAYPWAASQLMALQAASAYMRMQHDELPPSIQGAYAGAGRGGGRAVPAGLPSSRPGGAAAFHAAATQAARPLAFAPAGSFSRFQSPALHPTGTFHPAFHPGFRRGGFGFGYGYPYAYAYPYPYVYGGIDPSVYCPANGYYPR